MQLPINEIAERLGLSPGTLERWIRQGRIPVQKSGRHGIFNEALLKKWAHNHHLTFLPPRKKDLSQSEPPLENLTSAMQRGGIFYNLKGDSVEAVLSTGVQNIPLLTAAEKEMLLDRLIEREQLASTGIGKGVAIPHPRAPLADILQKPIITTCFLEKPVDFGAVDNIPVFVVFILLSPSVKHHLHLLSRLAFCLRNEAFVNLLKSRPAADRLIEQIARFEKQLDRAGSI